MPRNYDELNGMIAELIRKTKAEPSDADFQLLKTVSIKDIAQFFESVAQEKNDQKRYEKLLDWLHHREEEKLAVVRRAEEERLAKIRAEEEAKRKAEEQRLAKIKAEEDAKKKAEEDRLAKIKAEEDAKKAAAEAKAAKEKADAEAKAQAAAEEKARKEEERKEKLKTNVGCCENCNKWIPKNEKYLECENDDGSSMFLHPECQEAWEQKNCPPCAQCGKLCTEDFVNLSRGDTKVTLHESCVDAYKAAHK
jgi:hypothetical protein